MLVGINYEPELAGIAPYSTGLAKHWASQGHGVTVVTGLPHYPQWRRLPYRSSEPYDNPRVYRYGHFIPRRPRALGRSLYEVTWLLSAVRAVPRRRSTVVIGIVPSLSGAVIAWLIARKHRIPFGIIYQDLMGSAAVQSGYMGAKGLASFASGIELSLARRASGVAIVAEGFRPYLEGGGVTRSKIFRVRNWIVDFTPTVSPIEMRHRLRWTAEDVVCLHAGNMGQKQALDNLLESARLVAGKNIKVVLAGDGNDRAHLVRRTRELGLTNVQFLGVLPPGLYESMLRAADILVINQRESVSDMALPSKLTSYAAAGRPIVAAVSPRSEAAREIEESGAGIVVPPNEPGALARELTQLAESREIRDVLTGRAQSYVRELLTAEKALPSYDSFLDHLVGSEGVTASSDHVRSGVGA